MEQAEQLHPHDQTWRNKRSLWHPHFLIMTTLQRNIELVWIKIVKLGHSIYEFNLTFPVLRLLQLENYKSYTGRVEGVLDVIYMFIYSHPCVLAIYGVLFLQKIIIIQSIHPIGTIYQLLNLIVFVVYFYSLLFVQKKMSNFVTGAPALCVKLYCIHSLTAENTQHNEKKYIYKKNIKIFDYIVHYKLSIMNKQLYWS